MKNVLAPVRFLRLALAGHWLAPWKSPYLRWRIETYSGIPAESINAHIFWRFLSSERGRLLHFLRWTVEIESYAQPRAK